jgi:hypothetical protein
MSKATLRPFLRHSHLSLALATAVLLAPALAAALTPTVDDPLIVDRNSHVAVMEYEAWFGPNAVTFQGAAAKPLLQSADMRPVGGGYDSADPAVIKQHTALMEYIGIDAALIEVTNNVSCIFNSEQFAKKYIPNCTPAFHLQNRTIRDNTGNLYSAWSELKTPLKLIPMVGGIDQDVLFVDSDGRTAFEKEIEYFGARMHEHPGRNVIYKGKPLMLIYLGAAQDPSQSDNPLWFQIRKFLENHPDIGNKYTFRMMAGFIDSQPGLWAVQDIPDAPVRVNPSYGFWSWIDRLNPTCTVAPLCPYFPSFNEVHTRDSDRPGDLAKNHGTADSRVENFTVSIATAGQSGWGCPDPNTLPYCPDDALRFGSDRSSVTLDSFMTYARELHPTFLIIHQFNEFVPSDEGFDANTDDDVEPANLWGFGALNAVRGQLERYRRHIADENISE